MIITALRVIGVLVEASLECAVSEKPDSPYVALRSLHRVYRVSPSYSGTCYLIEYMSPATSFVSADVVDSINLVYSIVLIVLITPVTSVKSTTIAVCILHYSKAARAQTILGPGSQNI